MPRHTHPASRHRHDRAHIRFHRDRIIDKRWGDLKTRRWDGGLHPDIIQAAIPRDWKADRGWFWDLGNGAAGMGTGGWWFSQPKNKLSDCHPDRRCSCMMCKGAKAWPGRRSRENRKWREDWGL